MRLEKSGTATVGSSCVLPAEIAFLAGEIDHGHLLAAARRASQAGCSPQRELIRRGAVDAEGYARRLALHIGGTYQTSLHPDEAARRLLARRVPREAAAAGLLLLRTGADGTGFAVDAESKNLGRVLTALRRRPFAGGSVAVVTGRTFARAVVGTGGAAMLDRACSGLARRAPELSALGGLARWQRRAFAVGCGLLAAALAVAPELTALVALFLASCLFLGMSVFRLAGASAAAHRAVTPLPEAELPVYTVLVPLFREGAVVGRLVAALKALDYPTARLDIKLLLEEDDMETRAAVAEELLPAWFDVVVVPKAHPRTKPKALNYGLQLRRGSLVCIFDAEDRPEPRQLKVAAATFAAHPDLACLQARLALYNWQDNWLSRQFALEYAMLFDVLLPFLDRWRLPIPLGGTSNHFRAALLERIGGWDAYNVTEDADLGMRLARLV